MFKEHKFFIIKLIVFFVMFWGAFYLATVIIPWISYNYISRPDPVLYDLLEKTSHLSEEGI